MDNQQPNEWFQNIDTIIAEPLNFKARLAIGEDAYTALKVKNAVVQAWDVVGVATTAAVVTKSSVVASTFFAPTGFLAALGIGTAVTPIGWVIAAGVVTGGAWMGITRYLKKASADKVTVIPNFINTPLDVLALGLFDMYAPLALKVAQVEGNIAESERKSISQYFIKQWGYDPQFVEEGMHYTESSLNEFSAEQLAQTLAKFTHENPDCNFREMSQEIVHFLKNVAAAGETRNEETINNIETIFTAADKKSLGKKVASALDSIRQKISRIFSRKNSKES